MLACTFKRSLGTATRGPKLRDIKGQLSHAADFFTKPALSYADFHQRCTSLRVFVFWGTISALTLDLIVNPLRSSYFTEWAPWRWPVNFIRQFTRPADSIFLRNQPERSIDVPTTFGFLIANRRLPEQTTQEAYAASKVEEVHHH